MVTIWRMAAWRMAAVAVVAMWVQPSFAQQPECRLYKVQSSILNISKEPRGDAPYIDVLDNADVVCVTRQQKTGEREWGFVDHKILDQDRTRPVGGWANLGLMQPVAAPDRRDAPAAAAPAPAPAEQIVRFSEPLTTGPFPVNGQSLEQLIQIEGLPEAAPTVAEAKRVAFVVGINIYDNLGRQLLKAVNDSKAVAGVLKDIGFQVIAAENTTRPTRSLIVAHNGYNPRVPALCRPSVLQH
jgi:hypothetical protein